MPASLEGAEAWLDCAEEHLKELVGLCEAVGKVECDTMIESLRVNEDTQGTAGAIAFTRPTAPVPQRIGILVGETIQALRRSLDYLVYELAWLDHGTIQDDTQFPIDSSKNVFNGRNQRKSKRDHSCYLIGLKTEHVTAIKRLQPFEGIDWTKALASISNPDKHRRLTVSRHEASGPHVQGWVTAPDGRDGQVERLSPTSFAVLWRVKDDSVPQTTYLKMYAGTFVAFEDRVEVAGLLKSLKSEVASVLVDFAPCFEGRCHH